MKFRLFILSSLSFFWACNFDETASGSHQTENVIAEIQLKDGDSLMQFSARVLQGEVSPFDTSSYSPVDVAIEGSSISFEKPSKKYWIEVIYEIDPKQVYWASIEVGEDLPEVIQLKDVAHMNAYYPPSDLDIVAIGVGGTDLVAEIDEFGGFRIENLPPGVHQCFGLAEILSEDETPRDSLVYLGSFGVVSGENIIDESSLF